MKYSFNIFVIFGSILMGIYGVFSENLFVFLYGMLGSIILILWEILEILNKNKK